MLILAGEVDHLADLGFRDLIAEDAAYADTLLMNVKHHPRRIFNAHAKEALEAEHDKLHGSIIVVEHQDLVGGRLFRTRAGARGDAQPGAPVLAILICSRLGGKRQNFGHSVTLRYCSSGRYGPRRSRARPTRGE